MPRWFMAFVLALVVPCYGLAAAGQLLIMAKHDGSHALAHMAGEGHHHHDDGSLHVDDSDESVQHLHADDCIHSPALLTATIAFEPFPAAVATVPDGWGTSLAPPPFLEGPRRPPRFLADLS